LRLFRAHVGWRADHTAAGQESCANCHAVSTATELPIATPGHATCLGCHEHEQQYAMADCDTCHQSFQEMPLEAIAEFDHTGNWLARHGQMAHSAGSACVQCHQETQCDDCHTAVPSAAPARLFPEQTDRELLHRGDFLASHPIEARTQPEMCVRCHSSQSCEDCHAVSGVTELSIDPLQVHPAGWMEPASVDFHGPQARLQTVACASCHDQGAESNCVDCHAVGGLGGNPHPSGWTDRFAIDEAGDNAMCQICHSPGL
jgi:hypothetical protein